MSERIFEGDSSIESAEQLNMAAHNAFRPGAEGEVREGGEAAQKTNTEGIPGISDLVASGVPPSLAVQAYQQQHRSDPPFPGPHISFRP